MNECPICGNLKHRFNVTCSKSCAAKKSNKAKYPEDINILIKEVEMLGYCGTGRKYDVSDNAIRKYIKNHSKKH